MEIVSEINKKYPILNEKYPVSPITELTVSKIYQNIEETGFEMPLTMRGIKFYRFMMYNSASVHQHQRVVTSATYILDGTPIYECNSAPNKISNLHYYLDGSRTEYHIKSTFWHYHV